MTTGLRDVRGREHGAQRTATAFGSATGSCAAAAAGLGAAAGLTASRQGVRPRPALKVGQENIAPAVRRGMAQFGSGVASAAAATACSDLPAAPRRPPGRAAADMPLRDITNVTAQGPPARQPRRPSQGPVPPRKLRCAELLASLEAEDGAQSAAEYVPSILDRLFQDELRDRPRPDYLEAQAEVNGRMRAILIDWLVEVHLRYRLQPSTLYLTVNLMDRYMSRAPVTRRRLQLVGVVAFFVAAKFEETSPPSAAELARMTDHAYTVEEIFQLECSFLTVLGFKVLAPTAVQFLGHFQRINCCEPLHRDLSNYILELSLLDHRLIRHEPSRIASAALLLSNEIVGCNFTWPLSLAVVTGHTAASLRACATELRACLDAVPPPQSASPDALHAIRKKYASVARRFE